MKWTDKGRQFDKLGQVFSNKNRILIYGAGAWGAAAYQAIRFLGCIDAFIDRDPEKQRAGLLGLPVISPQEMLGERYKNHFILLAVRDEFKPEIRKTLLCNGLVEGVDFMEESVFRASDVYLPVFWLYAQNRVYLSSSGMIPSTVCNLNCEKCLNFTPQLNAKNRHVIKSLQDMQYEADLLFRWVDYVPRLQISGGEPLLYPHFCQMVTYIGENYRLRIGDRFEVVLNGTVVPDEEQCDVMRRYDMLVIVDDYEQNVPKSIETRKRIFETLERHHVRYVDNSVLEWFDLGVENTDNSHMSDKELTEYFDRCANPWHHQNKGKMYACNYVGFAIQAGMVGETRNDYFDLTQEATPLRKKEFMEFALGFNSQGHVDMCKRCAGWCSINKTSIPVALQAGREKL